MLKPRSKYTGILNLDPVVQGNTLDGFSFEIKNPDDSVKIPDKICAQLRDKNLRLVHEFITSVDADGSCIVSGISAEDTARIPVGSYVFGVRVEVDGRVRDYLEGSVTILEAIPRCE